MIKIKAPINFDIVDQMANGTSLEYIYEGYEPSEVTSTPKSMAYMRQALTDDLQVINTPMVIECFGDQLKALEYERAAHETLLKRELKELEALAEISATDADYKRFFCTDLDEEAIA